MAIDPKRLAGVANLSVDGRRYMLADGLQYGVSTVERTSLVGQDRPHGYSEKPRVGFVSATLRDAYGMSVADFNAMTNVSVVAELANGKTIVGRNMWTVEAQEVNTMEGTFAVRWEGEFVEEA